MFTPKSHHLGSGPAALPGARVRGRIPAVSPPANIRVPSVRRKGGAKSPYPRILRRNPCPCPPYFLLVWRVTFEYLKVSLY
jgi:hypothetical protein